MGYCAGKLIENRCFLQLFYKSNRLHFLGAYQRNTETHLDVGKTRKKLVNHVLEASDLPAFRVFQTPQVGLLRGLLLENTGS